LHANHIHGNELKTWLTRHFEALPANSVVKLKIHGKISPEIGEILNISVDAAKKRLARGRQMFRAKYERLEGRFGK